MQQLAHPDSSVSLFRANGCYAADSRLRAHLDRDHNVEKLRTNVKWSDKRQLYTNELAARVLFRESSSV
jgi:hypothetical protein